MKSVSIKEFALNLKLESIVDIDEERVITTSEVNRIGLQLVQYYKHFASKRIQIVGNSEYSYLKELESSERRSIADSLMSYDIPCVVFTQNLDVYSEFIDAAKEKEIPIYRTKYYTTKFISKSLDYLDRVLAKTVTIHGVLVDVYGIGILITGKSGIGKSETALELIKRGHRFIGDDAITIRKKGEESLVGEAPNIIRNLLEIRGIGIIDVSKLYGIGSVREEKVIDLVIEFDEWDKTRNYDRLGLESKNTEILDFEVAKLEIPVKPGRNLAMIVEAAAINHRQKRMGFNAAAELEDRMLNM